MQCDDVIRQLGGQTADELPAALAGHIAGCAACAEWAKCASQLDRLWEATRAPEPPLEAWDQVWDHIAASLDSSTPMHVEHSMVPTESRNGSISNVGESVGRTSPSLHYHRRSFANVGLFSLAKAAVVLLVVSLAWQFLPSFQKLHSVKRATPSASTSQSAEPALLPVDIEEGSLVVIRSEGERPKVLVLTSENSPFGIDDWLLMLNFAETIAPNPVVAMKE